MTANTSMYNDIDREYLRVIEPVARDHGVEVVDATVSRGGGTTRLRIFVDTPEGDGRVTVDTCAGLHKEVRHGLAASGAVAGALSLEVSSPGVDRVLGREIDFERAVGREVSLETREPVEGRRRFRGELVTFRDGVASLRVQEQSFDIAFADIARARALYPFSTPRTEK